MLTFIPKLRLEAVDMLKIRKNQNSAFLNKFLVRHFLLCQTGNPYDSYLFLVRMHGVDTHFQLVK